ncbi:apolipoprotein(a)-like isoform X1 [Ruditapes philippinarum]|uniref:apolipoprotein(a)-like isoform X1 n=1 Tax=Ruditapes philippinarum TaxID=129788 RepID=UPI00295BA9F6|nr:apolipoprotein(a)-like isoform X1 [Ruditapes philippinarum]
MILLFYLTVSAYSVLGFQTPCYYGTTANYSGYLNVTVTLFHCERWDAHISDVNSTWDFSVDGSIEKAGSYCRDPNSSGQLWCYSTNPVRKVENCSIVACEDAAVSKSYQLIRGDNKTAMLKSFDDVWRCHYIPDDGCFMTEKTLCVMFATDGETCLKYMCCVNRGCYEGSTSTYTEDWEHTYTYKECHKWALIPPSMLIYTQFNSSAHITQSNNYCRDMVNDGVLYCFTEEFEKVSCGIPSCSEQASMNKYPHSCYNITLKDRISVGLPGNATEKQVCESLTDKSYINSTSEEVLGCQGCKCCQRVGCYEEDPRSYRGTWSHSSSGHLCKRWEDQDIFLPNTDIPAMENFCRYYFGTIGCFARDNAANRSLYMPCPIKLCSNDNQSTSSMDPRKTMRELHTGKMGTPLSDKASRSSSCREILFIQVFIVVYGVFD